MWLPLSLQLFLFLLLLLLLLSVAVTCGSYWRRRGVAGPYGFPLVGNMLHFALGLRSYGDVYARLYNSYSSLSYVGIYRLFNEPALLLRDQSIVRELLIGGHFTHCAENAIHVNVERDVLAAQNPFIACGEHWRKQRGELLPLFTPLRLRQTLPHIAAACHQLQKFVAQRNPRELACLEAKELATRYTLQVVASAVFGLNAQCLDPDDSSRSESRSEWLQLLGPLFQPSSWSLAETIALLHSPRLVQLMEYRANWMRWLLIMMDNCCIRRRWMHCIMLRPRFMRLCVCIQRCPLCSSAAPNPLCCPLSNQMMLLLLLDCSWPKRLC
ncbi:probable cytochrome P450 308a1 isoform X2 [Drosophila nasuta]|uniref:probable cytochrome P450 308a1 isoform X2 n=1 Tax=Drosophila nasuta TaxID=42062 RepID=UPI00295EF7B1|nr:probable cytochrome P450 308a1 isoform X2 [Drosophila nasuta]